MWGAAAPRRQLSLLSEEEEEEEADMIQASWPPPPPHSQLLDDTVHQSRALTQSLSTPAMPSLHPVSIQQPKKETIKVKVKFRQNDGNIKTDTTNRYAY